MLEFPYERLSDHLSLFCVPRDKYHDDKFAQTKQKLFEELLSILKHLFLFQTRNDDIEILR